ncbi:MAG: indole-3-glycerol phosphate synthase TrpC [Betaproteobacteria bacterium]|nr:indole-3-glycerol phosphate synthase TrpC [Betaproteobacteria bacterium]
MAKTSDILKKIIARKKQEIKACKAAVSVDKMLERAYENRKTRDFYQALKDKTAAGKSAIIAEIKKASPSKGVLRADFNPAEIAKSYEKFGATCLSVLTDKDFFQGDNQHLNAAREATNLPVLRKEFIIDPYQIYESRVLGADCILLIAACLSDAQLEDLAMRAIGIKMDVLLEVHNLEELKRTRGLGLPMIGINNRNLKTFEISLNTTINLLDEITTETLIITESGILNKADVALMKSHNINSFLVGEALMRQANPGQALEEIFG